MEDLTKQQLVLISLLVSFVTSIATGILTVSLMAQNPIATTQTVNQVVERTIERIIPDQNQAASALMSTDAAVSTSDLAARVVDKNSKRIVRIKFQVDGEDAASVHGIGIVVSKSGIIAADSSITFPNAAYSGVLPDGTEVPLTLIKNDTPPVAFFTPTTPLAKSGVILSVVFGDSNQLKLGQNLVILTGTTARIQSLGIIERLEETAASSSSRYANIGITSDSSRIVAGSPVFTMSGELVGIRGANSVVPLNAIKDSIATAVGVSGK